MVCNCSYWTKGCFLILDVSGSMAKPAGSTTRWELAKEAAVRVLYTLTKYDYATIVAFSSKAKSYSTVLKKCDREELCKMEN